MELLVLLPPSACFQSPDQLLVKRGVEDIEDICQRSVNDLVVVRQAVELVGCKVQVNSVAFTHTVDYWKSAKIQITTEYAILCNWAGFEPVCISVGVIASSLEVLATHKASIDVDPDEIEIFEVQ